MNTYAFNTNLKIILYGVNVYSKNLQKALAARNYDVCAFIDKRAQELRSIDNVNVYTMEQIRLLDDLKSACVIIMLQNALQHESIAKTLYDIGFSKIIFIPMKLNCHTCLADQFRRIYNLILLEQLENLDDIPFYSELLAERKKDLHICDISKDYLTIRVSVDAIYTNPARVVKDNSNLLKYADIPLVAYKPYDKLFECLQGLDDDIEEYLQDYGINSCNYSNSYQNRDIIIQRENLYNLWEEHFQNNFIFFVSSAPLAEWNQKGYINLLEGQHRTLFLIKKGIYFVPIRVSRKDYQEFCKFNIVDEIVESNMYLNNIALDALLLNNNRKITLTKVMLELQKKIEKEIYLNKKVLDISMYDGYYGINFLKMGADKITICIENSVERNRLNEFVRRNYTDGVIEVNESIKYDCINKFETIILLGNNDFIDSYKKYVFLNLQASNNEYIIFSCTEDELSHLSDYVREKARFITRIFINGELVNIFLYTSKLEDIEQHNGVNKNVL